jgi:cyclopropane fatty-acyl-phospholipid synthase-like methyltransferase
LNRATYNNQDIGFCYNLTQNHYEKWWGLNKSQALHYGIWDKHTPNFHKALENTNNIMIHLAGISSSDKVLDAGCGVGGAAIYLNKYSNARVTGITLSEKQLTTARSLAEENGVADKVKFELQDYTETSFENESFDVIWACESVCHASDKNNFLKEEERLLTSGGRLIVCDFFKTSENQIDKNDWVKKWCDTWAVTDLASTEAFQNGLQQLQFNNITVHDYTDKIEKSAKRMYYAWMLGIVPSELYNLFHPKVSRFAKNHYKCGRYQYKALKADLWKYQIFTAIKP